MTRVHKRSAERALSLSKEETTEEKAFKKLDELFKQYKTANDIKIDY